MIQLLHGDCLDLLPTLADASVDSCVADPPYHLTSIVKRFGAATAAPAKGGVYARSSAGFMGQTWDGGDIAFRPEVWAEVLRVLRPGAYLVAFASSRGYHRMVCAIEDAGFIIHPMLGWINGQGFPKAHKVEAEGWEGWRYGLQSLKPALEPICLAQKPMSENTGTANVLRWGTGAINVDGCRVEGRERTEYGLASAARSRGSVYGQPTSSADFDASKGRWPANLCHDGSPEVLEAFARFGPHSSAGNINPTRQPIGFNGAPGRDALPINYRDTGTAARFFFCGKATKAERAGSKHPTVKPLALMQWLCRLVTPPGGTVLDPFAGSGSTGVAASREGFRATLIEREAEYVADIRRRIAGDAGLFAEVA